MKLKKTTVQLNENKNKNTGSRWTQRSPKQKNSNRESNALLVIHHVLLKTAVNYGKKDEE